MQNNQPLFVAVWIGSIVASVTAAGLGFGQLDSLQRLLLVAAPLVYILGVQLSTFTINVPLNNQLQALNVDAIDEAALKAARMNSDARSRRLREGQANRITNDIKQVTGREPRRFEQYARDIASVL